MEKEFLKNIKKDLNASYKKISLIVAGILSVVTLIGRITKAFDGLFSSSIKIIYLYIIFLFIFIILLLITYDKINAQENEKKLNIPAKRERQF